MKPRLLLDTHVVVRWLVEPKRLSRDQARLLTQAVRLQGQVAVSAMTLVEFAILLGGRIDRMKMQMDEVFGELEMNPIFQILPITIEIAKEVDFLQPLRDPGDRVIVATARVHGLRLLTSDPRIIQSNFVSTVE